MVCCRIGALLLLLLDHHVRMPGCAEIFICRLRGIPFTLFLPPGVFKRVYDPPLTWKVENNELHLLGCPVRQCLCQGRPGLVCSSLGRWTTTLLGPPCAVSWQSCRRSERGSLFVWARPNVGKTSLLDDITFFHGRTEQIILYLFMDSCNACCYRTFVLWWQNSGWRWFCDRQRSGSSFTEYQSESSIPIEIKRLNVCLRLIGGKEKAVISVYLIVVKATSTGFDTSGHHNRQLRGLSSGECKLQVLMLLHPHECNVVLAWLKIIAVDKKCLPDQWIGIRK